LIAPLFRQVVYLIVPIANAKFPVSVAGEVGDRVTRRVREKIAQNMAHPIFVQINA
jgi:hypothetical protein